MQIVRVSGCMTQSLSPCVRCRVCSEIQAAGKTSASHLQKLRPKFPVNHHLNNLTHEIAPRILSLGDGGGCHDAVVDDVSASGIPGVLWGVEAARAVEDTGRV